MASKWKETEAIICYSMQAASMQQFIVPSVVTAFGDLYLFLYFLCSYSSSPSISSHIPYPTSNLHPHFPIYPNEFVNVLK